MCNVSTFEGKKTYCGSQKIQELKAFSGKLSEMNDAVGSLICILQLLYSLKDICESFLMLHAFVVPATSLLSPDINFTDSWTTCKQTICATHAKVHALLIPLFCVNKIRSIPLS